MNTDWGFESRYELREQWAQVRVWGVHVARRSVRVVGQLARTQQGVPGQPGQSARGRVNAQDIRRELTRSFLVGASQSTTCSIACLSAESSSQCVVLQQSFRDGTPCGCEY